MSANIRRMSCLSPYWSIACITTIHTVCTKEDKKYIETDRGVFDFYVLTMNPCVVWALIFSMVFWLLFIKWSVFVCSSSTTTKTTTKRDQKWTQTNEYCRQVSLCAIQWTDVCVHAYHQYTDFYLQHWSKSYSKKDRQTLRREHSSHLYEAKVIQFKCANNKEKKRERDTKKGQTIVCLQCNRIRCVIWIRLVRLCAHCKQRRARKKEKNQQL